MKLTQQQLDAANALAQGCTVREAARRAGCHEVSVSRWRARKDFQRAEAILKTAELAGMSVKPIAMGGTA